MRASSFYYAEHLIFTFAQKSQGGAGQEDYCPLCTLLIRGQIEIESHNFQKQWQKCKILVCGQSLEDQTSATISQISYFSLIYQNSGFLHQNGDFKSVNPSKTQTLAQIEPKLGLVLIRPMRDCLTSFLYVADRMPSDQLGQGDVNFENSNFMQIHYFHSLFILYI